MTNLTATGGDRSLTLRWTAPALPNDVVLVEYSVGYKNAANVGSPYLSYGATRNTETRVPGLTRGVEYEVRVAPITDKSGTGLQVGIWSYATGTPTGGDPGGDDPGDGGGGSDPGGDDPGGDEPGDGGGGSGGGDPGGGGGGDGDGDRDFGDGDSGDGDGDSDDGDSGDDDGDGQDDDGDDGSDGGGVGNTSPSAQCPRPQESAYSASISNRCDEFDAGYCHQRRLGEVFLRRNASSTVVLLESESDFDLCVYDRDRTDEWPKPIYVARKEDCVNYSLDSHGLQAQLTGKVEDHGVEIAELPDIARMDYCVVPFGDAVGRWAVRFHQPATLYGTVVSGSRRCPRWYSDNGETCASSGGSNYANLTVKLENCRGTWIDKGGSCDEPFVVRPEERADLADDGAEKCVVVNEDRTLRDVDGVRRPTLELAYCFFGDGTRRLGTHPD